LSARTATAPAAGRAGRATPLSPGRQLVADYIDLTKPKVQSLLLFTTVATMEVAGNPSIGLIALTCLGGYLSAGGAGAVNHYWDRDIDARMARTADRPVPSGRVSPRAALIFGIVLIFIHIPHASLIYAILGLVIFAGLTAADFQRLRRSRGLDSAPLIAASIFLDILNVFFFFLRIFSGSRD